MKKTKRVTSLILAGILAVTGCSNGKTKISSLPKNSTDTNKIITTTIIDSEISTTTTVPNTTRTSLDTTTSIETTTTEITTIPTTSATIDSSVNEEVLDEDSLIKNLEDQEALIMDDAVNGKLDKLKEKLDEYFTLTVGFLFCDQPIKGKTLDDLSTSAKIKIVSISSNINDVIEQYYPDYKLTIKEKYTDIKEWSLDKLKTGTSYMKDKIIDTIGIDNYNKVLDKYESAKTKIKDIASNLWDKAGNLVDEGKEKIKEWWKKRN